MKGKLAEPQMLHLTQQGKEVFSKWLGKLFCPRRVASPPAVQIPVAYSCGTRVEATPVAAGNVPFVASAQCERPSQGLPTTYVPPRFQGQQASEQPAAPQHPHPPDYARLVRQVTETVMRSMFTPPERRSSPDTPPPHRIQPSTWPAIPEY